MRVKNRFIYLLKPKPLNKNLHPRNFMDFRQYAAINGLCRQCGSPDLKTSWLCAPCLEKANAVVNAVYIDRRNRGLCLACKVPLPKDSKFTRCESCRNKATRFKQAERQRKKEAKKKTP